MTVATTVRLNLIDNSLQIILSDKIPCFPLESSSNTKILQVSMLYKEIIYFLHRKISNFYFVRPGFIRIELFQPENCIAGGFAHKYVRYSCIFYSRVWFRHRHSSAFYYYKLFCIFFTAVRAATLTYPYPVGRGAGKKSTSTVHSAKSKRRVCV